MSKPDEGRPASLGIAVPLFGTIDSEFLEGKPGLLVPALALAIKGLEPS